MTQGAAPGDHVSTCDGPELRRLAQPGEGGKFAHIVFISAPGFGVGDVGEPFELGGTSARSPNWVGVRARAVQPQPGPWPSSASHARPCFLGTLPRRIPNTTMYVRKSYSLMRFRILFGYQNVAVSQKYGVSYAFGMVEQSRPGLYRGAAALSEEFTYRRRNVFNHRHRKIHEGGFVPRTC
jgi:hypothetical protein